LFNNLQKEVTPQDDLEFEVFVFDRNEKGRHWSLKEADLNFKCNIDDSSYYRKVGGFNLRYNPNYFRTILKQPETHLILGSSWNDPNIILTVILKRMGLLKNKISFWSEANYHTVLKSSAGDSFVKKTLRTFVLNTCDGNFLLPGVIAQKTIFEIWNIRRKSVIYFPNLPAADYTVNEALVEKNSVEEDFFLRIIIVARHLEMPKGILQFLKSLKTFDGLKVYLAGDGEDTDLYKSFVKKRNLQQNIYFLGNLNARDLINYYQKSDVCVLPSIFDQSPLAIVEAASQGMPLFVSERCGNHPELVEEGVNGFIFNPDDSFEINLKIDKFKAFSKFKLNQMGENSKNLIRLNYDHKKVLRNFIDKI
jgi:glycosyltransferase involved in cell wall biosynthesis